MVRSWYTPPCARVVSLVLHILYNRGVCLPFLRVSSDVGTAARLTSAVKPMYEFSPSEAIIDIKLDSEDPFNDDLSYGPDNVLLSRKRPPVAPSNRAQRPAAPLYRPPGSSQSVYQVTEGTVHRLLQGTGQPPRPRGSQVSRAPNVTVLYDPQAVSPTEETYISAIASATARTAQEVGTGLIQPDIAGRGQGFVDWDPILCTGPDASLYWGCDGSSADPLIGEPQRCTELCVPFMAFQPNLILHVNSYSS